MSVGDPAVKRQLPFGSSWLSVTLCCHVVEQVIFISLSYCFPRWVFDCDKSGLMVTQGNLVLCNFPCRLGFMQPIILQGGMVPILKSTLVDLLNLLQVSVCTALQMTSVQFYLTTCKCTTLALCYLNGRREGCGCDVFALHQML